MTKQYIVTMGLLLVIILQLFWITMILDSMLEDRVLRLTEIVTYNVDILSHGTIVVPTEIDYPGNPSLFVREGR